VIAAMGPMAGARDFLDALRRDYQVIILSDTFYEFAMPLMAPARHADAVLPQAGSRRRGLPGELPPAHAEPEAEAVKRFKQINFKVIAAGDSYNDTAMLAEADAGILFHPPQNVIDEFPQFPVTMNYAELRAEIDKASARI
jgi:phosphoserine/homoserine phosphotransferase